MRNEKVFKKMADNFLKVRPKKFGKCVLLVIPAHADVEYIYNVLVVLSS